MTSSRSKALPSENFEPLPFAVVGMGASAGGIEALLNFFENAPSDMDMAFVVIVHLPADHMSRADEVLQRVTDMPVKQVSSTSAIEKNHIYINAPGKHLEMSQGQLEALDRAGATGSTTTIDHFFATLATAHGPRSIGIVMSGSGSDGAAGLLRIKEMGGITVAQKPEDAHFAEMPQHAITTARSISFCPRRKCRKSCSTSGTTRRTSICRFPKATRPPRKISRPRRAAPSARSPTCLCNCACVPATTSATTSAQPCCGASSGACR